MAKIFVILVIVIMLSGIIFVAEAHMALATTGAATGATTGFAGLKENLNAVIGIVFGTTGGERAGLWDILGGLIKIFLGFLGIIFLGLMLYAGYMWMTAMGDAEKVTKAKDTIIAATIGIVIVMGAYAIVGFVIPEIIRVVTEPPR